MIQELIQIRTVVPDSSINLNAKKRFAGPYLEQCKKMNNSKRLPQMCIMQLPSIWYMALLLTFLPRLNWSLRRNGLSNCRLPLSFGANRLSQMWVRHLVSPTSTTTCSPRNWAANSN